jgi:hypothetical protein
MHIVGYNLTHCWGGGNERAERGNADCATAHTKGHKMGTTLLTKSRRGEGGTGREGGREVGPAVSIIRLPGSWNSKIASYDPKANVINSDRK